MTMNKINVHSNEAANALQAFKIPYRLLEKTESDVFFTGFYDKFIVDKKYRYPLWEYFDSENHAESNIQDQEAWQRLGGMLEGKPINLFFEHEDDAHVFEIYDGGRISEMLGDCYPFVFYIADPKLAFYLSFNDHGFLSAGGDAAAWLQEGV